MRTVRHRKPENFLSSVMRNGHAIAEEAQLTPTEAADEALVMGLRLTEGIDPAGIERRFDLSQLLDPSRVAQLIASGYLTRHGAQIAATAKGRLVLDHILGDIAAAEPRVWAVA